MARRALLITFQFPPFAGSSAVERSLRFAQYLPEFGWDPIVLTAHQRGFSRTSAGPSGIGLEDLHIERAFTLDAAQHLAIRGWYPRFAALPDRWSTWLLGAVPAGLRLIKRYAPEVIWSTYPIATTMLVGLLLHRYSGLPWIADFRDPMYDDTYPPSRLLRSVHRRIDGWTIRNCARAVFTAPGAVDMYRSRYPDIAPERFALIANGYDEASVGEILSAQAAAKIAPAPIELLHSGVVYPTERDPSALFGAIADLARDGRIVNGHFKLVLRASGHDAILHEQAQAFGILPFVETRPPVPYKDALAEMASADGLLVLQGDDCAYQIPAKVYEYLRIGRPILGLVGEKTDTAQVLQDAGVSYLAPLDSRAKVRVQLERFLRDVATGTAQGPRLETALGHSRRRRTAQLAQLFEETLQDFSAPRDSVTKRAGGASWVS